MEKARKFLELSEEESKDVSRLTVQPVRVGFEIGFFDRFAVKGIRVDRAEPGCVSCTFKVPPRLIDRSGNLANGAIASMVDLVGGAVVYVEGVFKVSVDMSISFVSTARVDDELEITSRALGERGRYHGTNVLVRNNKATGELIAEGRHSLFSKPVSKM